jgi:hypothetical protein
MTKDPLIGARTSSLAALEVSAQGVKSGGNEAISQFSRELVIAMVNSQVVHPHSSTQSREISPMTLKSTVAIAAAILTLGAAAHAGDLYRLNPPQSPFTATGQGTITGSPGSYACSISMSGTTGKSTGMITGLTFSGAAGCENVMPIGLPWNVRAISLKKLQISHVSLSYPGLGRCGPNQVKAVLSQGTISIQDHLPSKTGVCDVNVSLSTSPTLSITTGQ